MNKNICFFYSLRAYLDSLDLVYLLIVIIVLSAEKIQVEGIETCKSIQLQDDNGIVLHWSETPVGELRPPSPLCIGKDDNSLQRRCMENGFWEEFEPKKCTFFALKKFSACPYGMEKLELDDDEICYSASAPTKWKNSCLHYGATKSVLKLSSEKFRSLVNHLREVKKINEFWLPAKRYQDYYPFQWQLAGEKWGETIDFDDYELGIEDNYKDNCLKFVIGSGSFKFESEDCSKEIPEVCVFDENATVELACKTGFTSRYSFHQNKCFSVDKSLKLQTKNLFQVTKFYSRKFIRNLMKSFDLNSKDLCLVDFGTVDSQNYFTNASFGNYTVINRDGKWLMAGKYTCAIYEESIDLQVPEIYLKFDANSGKMLMTIYSAEFLWKDDDDESGAKCFTIADNELVKVAKIKSRLWSETIKKYDVKLFDGKKAREVSKSIYEVKLYGSGPGVYWCEGHAIESFQLIMSKKVIARRKIDGFVFAVTLESKVPTTDHPIYDQKFLNSLTTSLEKVLANDEKLDIYEKLVVDSIKSIRVMKIDQLNETQLTAIYHVTLMKSIEHSSEEYDDFMEKYAEKFDDVKVMVNHQLKKYLETILRKVGGRKFKLLSIHSTEYCLPESIKNPNPLTELLVWEQAFIGETLPPTDLCLYQSGIPLTRKCEGDFLHGGKWETLTEQKLQCIDKEILSLHTKRLFSFNKVISSNETHDIIENMTSISSHYDQLIPADIFYISKTIQQITNAANVTQGGNLHLADLDEKYNLTIILNNIMNVNDSYIQLSQLKLNATNILLDSYDNLINSLSTNYSIYATINNNLISNSLNETDGTFIMRTEKIVVFICDPGRMNVSGMALIRNQKDQNGESLMDYRVEKLYASQTIDDILNIYQDSLEIASFVPDELLSRIDEIHNLENVTTGSTEPMKIVIKVYYNDAIFKESNPVSSYKSQSKIISVSIPGHDQNLPLLLPIMFKKAQTVDISNVNVCGYWEFQPSGESSESSEWMQQGCEFLGVSKYDEDLALCGCSHLTHFAYLIMGTYIHDISPGEDVIVTKFNAHSGALNAITLLGSTLSILGIIGIFITAVCFKAWRDKASTKILLQLSLAIALQMILFSFFSTEKHTYTIDTFNEKRACIALGSSLHYSVLVTFSWMLITAFLQFKRYVIVLGNLKPERFFLKAFLIGWLLPLIPIVIVLAVDPFLYIPETYGICYPQGFAFYFSVLLPVGLIVVANLVIFIFVIYNILKTGPSIGCLRKSEQNMTLSQLRVSIFLFFLLGLTWIFGLLASSQTTILFSYLFCLTATIQGFVLFLYFIVMDPITRKLWRESFRMWKTRN